MGTGMIGMQWIIFIGIAVVIRGEKRCVSKFGRSENI